MLGRQIAVEPRDRRHDVRALSRRAPEYRVDLQTRAGLDAPLRPSQVNVDVSNDSSRRSRNIVRAAQFHEPAATTLAAAPTAALDVVRDPDKLTAVPRLARDESPDWGK
jgi:hypothetical protein